MTTITDHGTPVFPGDGALWEVRARNTSHRLMLFCIAYYTDPSTGWTDTSHRDLARLMGLTARRVQGILGELETLGSIAAQRDRTAPDGGTKPNRYRVLRP